MILGKPTLLRCSVLWVTRETLFMSPVPTLGCEKWH